MNYTTVRLYQGINYGYTLDKEYTTDRLYRVNNLNTLYIDLITLSTLLYIDYIRT